MFFFFFCFSFSYKHLMTLIKCYNLINDLFGNCNYGSAIWYTLIFFNQIKCVTQLKYLIELDVLMAVIQFVWIWLEFDSYYAPTLTQWFLILETVLRYRNKNHSTSREREIWKHKQHYDYLDLQLRQSVSQTVSRAVTHSFNSFDF